MGTSHEPDSRTDRRGARSRGKRLVGHCHILLPFPIESRQPSVTSPNLPQSLRKLCRLSPSRNSLQTVPLADLIACEHQISEVESSPNWALRLGDSAPAALGWLNFKLRGTRTNLTSASRPCLLNTFSSYSSFLPLRTLCLQSMVHKLKIVSGHCRMILGHSQKRGWSEVTQKRYRSLQSWIEEFSDLCNFNFCSSLQTPPQRVPREAVR